MALEDPDPFVRFNAANALARRGDPASVPVLQGMLSTADLTELLRAPTETETQNRVEALQLEALAALEEGVEAGHLALIDPLRPALEALGRSRGFWLINSVRGWQDAVLDPVRGASQSVP